MARNKKFVEGQITYELEGIMFPTKQQLMNYAKLHNIPVGKMVETKITGTKNKLEIIGVADYTIKKYKYTEGWFIFLGVEE